jgi:hypothetical protein
MKVFRRIESSLSLENESSRKENPRPYSNWKRFPKLLGRFSERKQEVNEKRKEGKARERRVTYDFRWLVKDNQTTRTLVENPQKLLV